MENETDPVDPANGAEEFDPVGVADEQSFPASDPPSAWSGLEGQQNESPEHKEG